MSASIGSGSCSNEQQEESHDDDRQPHAPTATVTTPTDREIHIERIFDAPRDRVFAVYTDPALIPEWWGPRETTTVRAAKSAFAAAATSPERPAPTTTTPAGQTSTFKGEACRIRLGARARPVLSNSR
ncbi:MAG: hypothetical protein M3376_01990 [Actinomycetota bacterium]|nr:hypothetical protein [Actinomycetota bacterium]